VAAGVVSTIRLPAVELAERSCPELGTDPGVPSLRPRWPRSRRGMGSSPIARGSIMNRLTVVGALIS